MRKLLILFFSSCSFLLAAQNSFSGIWEGEITSMENGVTRKDHFEMYLSQNGTKVVGVTWLTARDRHAEIEIEGEVHNGNYLIFEDKIVVKLVAEEDLEACLKKGHLLIKIEKEKAIITGIWEGHTSFSVCHPGRIRLTKIEPRAAVDTNL